MSTLEITCEPFEMGMDPTRLARIQTHFEGYVDDGRLAGWLATVSRGGHLVWTGRSGHREREKGLAVTDDTLWRIYSMTKPVTSIAAMMLYEEGLFDLTDDVGRWIEEFAEPRVYVGGDAVDDQSTPSRGPVRVHHLLSHTAGMTYGFQNLHPIDEMYRAKGYDFGGPPGATLVSAVADLCSCPLLFEPGTRWNYSESTAVLGRLIEIWSGQSLDAFFRTRILDPLGMADTDWWCPEDKRERLAQLYVPFERQAHPYEDLAVRATRWPGILDGGGGLISSAGDYQRFMAMLLNGGELDGVRLVSSRTLALMTENHLPGDGDLATTSVGRYGDADSAGLGFGLGFSVVIDRRRHQSLATEGTFGWGGAASTTFSVDPAEELSFAFYTQLIPPGTYPIDREFEALVYASLID